MTAPLAWVSCCLIPRLSETITLLFCNQVSGLLGICLDRRRSNQDCPSSAFPLEKRRRERGDLISASFPQILLNHPSCLPQHSEFLPFPGEWKSLSFTCLLYRSCSLSLIGSSILVHIEELIVPLLGVYRRSSLWILQTLPSRQYIFARKNSMFPFSNSQSPNLF